MLTRIEALNYRCFENMHLDLDNFGVIVGANGSGKTTLLDIPILVRDLIATGNAPKAILEAKRPHSARASSLKELVHKEKGNWFALCLEFKIPEHVHFDIDGPGSIFARPRHGRQPYYIRYEVVLEVLNNDELSVANEYLFTYPEVARPRPDNASIFGKESQRTGGRDRRYFFVWRDDPREAKIRPENDRGSRPVVALLDPETLAISKLQFEPRRSSPVTRWLLDTLFEEVVFFDPQWNELAAASVPGLPKRVVADGGNLPWLVKDLKEGGQERFDAWVEHVQSALPQITRIEAREREDDHHAYLRLQYNDDYDVTSTGLSEGTLRILSFTLLPFLVSPPKLLFLEEPENGIYPRAIETVLDAVSSIEGGQVLLSTHSPIVVANVELEQIRSMQINSSGAVSVVSGPMHPRLCEWQNEIDLGTLFATGVFG